jgi:hypothetical protein
MSYQPKVYREQGGNNLVIETGGTLTMKGGTIASTGDVTIDCSSGYTAVLDAAVWDDMRIVPGTFDLPGSADPAYVNYQPGGGGQTYRAYEFAQGDVANFTVQLPHNYKQGTAIKPHVHWTPGTRGNEEIGRTVGWKLAYSMANVNAAFPASSTATMTDSVTGTDHYHEISPSATITSTAAQVSAMLMCAIKRSTDDTWAGTSSGQLPLLLEVDFHYQIDTLGSRQELVK